MAKVSFKRIENSSSINSYPIEDGSVIISKDGKMFIDYDNTRASVGGTPDTAMSDSSTNSVQNKVVKKFVEDSISDLNQVSVTTLWENPNPRNAFASQTITLNSSDYDYIEVIYFGFGQSAYLFSGLQSVKAIPGYNIELTTVFYNNQSNVMLYAARSMRRTSDTVYSFTNAYYTSTDQSTTPRQMNDCCIPVKVIGYKYGKGLS